MNVGRIRLKLARMLAELGYKVNPEDMNRANTGGNKRVYPIWCTHGYDSNGNLCNFCSWHTMGECSKGFNLIPEDLRWDDPYAFTLEPTNQYKEVRI